MKTRFLIVIATLFLGNMIVSAQLTPDDVNRVAEKMYCPVCENIPLDDCHTPTCLEWRDEIARQLVDGRTDQEIIDYFIVTYGQHVVGIPQDEGLRNLSIIPPIFFSVLAIMIGLFTFTRWRGRDLNIAEDKPKNQSTIDNDYLAQIERDL